MSLAPTGGRWSRWRRSGTRSASRWRRLTSRLASNVVAAAIQEASLRAQIEATRRIIAAEEKSLQILRDQFRLGFAMRIDVAAQETALAQARATLPPLQEQFEQTRDLIRALAGNLPNQDVPETFELDALELPPELPLSLPAKLIEQRPDVRAAEAQLHAANAQVGVAVAAMLPQFSISGSARRQRRPIRLDVPPAAAHSGVWSETLRNPCSKAAPCCIRKRAADDALKQAAALYQSSVLTAYQNVADTLHASLSDAEALCANVRDGECSKSHL